MKLLLSITLVLVLAVGLGIVVQTDPGYVLLSRGHWSLEMTLPVFVLLLLLVFLAVYFLLRFLAYAWGIQGRVRAWRRERRRIQARDALLSGVLQMEEGEWHSAESALLLHVEHSDTPVLNYLSAARAAHHVGAHDRRDEYLRLASSRMPQAEIAIGIVQAKLQLEHQQLDQALTTVNNLYQVAPRHGYVLRLLMKLSLARGDWWRLLSLLPDLRKRKAIPVQEADTLEINTHVALLEMAVQSQDDATVRSVWHQVPRRLQGHPRLVLLYARYQNTRGRGDEAEGMLYRTLRRTWDDGLIRLYGQIESEDTTEQLARAEDWLHAHDDSPALLLTLGRLCMRHRLWGKARTYLDGSLRLALQPETCQTLGSLHEQLGEQAAALDYYRRGLQLTQGGMQSTVGS
ncbi:MAG: heme biosynthesis HemY N-terminal domain-containing protein [Gammaproteobacteria bacterium]|nr:heme biosynthesis HemY N-terminal domain-containing protein [Gammaproteobacteria bacterium]